MNGEPVPSQTLDTTSPDPGADAKDIYCPHCDYNLRGLTERRCPECGHEFDPGNMPFQPPMSEYLFEKQQWWNLRLFMRTALAGFRPDEFWKAVDGIGPPRFGMILWYWWAGALAYLLTIFLDVLTLAIYDARRGGPGASSFFFELFFVLYYFWVCPLSWSWSTFALLWVFRGSMRRPRVGAGRLLRCALYCFDAPLWMGIILLPFSVVAVFLALSGGEPRLDTIFIVTCLLLVVGAHFGSWRLCTALRIHVWADMPFVIVLMLQAAVLALTGIMFLAPVVPALIHY